MSAQVTVSTATVAIETTAAAIAMSTAILENSGADSNAGNSNNRNNGGNNSNAVNSSKRIVIAIAGIVFITIITMCFFPAVYRTAEKQKEQQRAGMVNESWDSVDNDTVQTLYQGSYVLYAEQMERNGQADAGGLF